MHLYKVYVVVSRPSTRASDETPVAVKDGARRGAFVTWAGREAVKSEQRQVMFDV